MARTRLLLIVSPFVLAGVASFFLPGPYWRGLLFGFALGPAIMFALASLFALRFRRAAQMSRTLEPPPLPTASWDYRINLTDLDGNPVNPDNWRGKVVLLNFWATWCAPCVAEMPGLARLSQQLADPSIQFAFISREDANVVSSFVAKRDLKLPFFILKDEPPPVFQGRAIPATFVIDRIGTVAMRHFGAAAWDAEPVATFLKGLSASPR
jgi:thiol-disulfide isomerase/thioredoxin